MMHNDDAYEDGGGAEELGMADFRLWKQLAPHLASPHSAGAVMSKETAALLEAACPSVEIERPLVTRLNDLAARAEVDLAYMAETSRKKRSATLGDYLAYLRARAGLSVAEAARKYAIDFQLLGELERDTVRPQRIPARRLAEMIRRLRGSLPLTEALLAGTIRAPRHLATAGHSSLYRKGSGGRPPAPSADLAVRLIDNPEYAEERSAVLRLVEEVRTAWAGK